MLAIAAAGISIAACQTRFERPPIEVLQRESLVGAGKIIQIKSLTNEELSEIEVTVKAEDREMHHAEPRLGGYETVEIGWKKLGGWQIPDNARVEVRAAGYLLPVRAHLTADGGPARDD